MSRAKNVYMFQIFYDEKTRAGLDPDLIPLDNTENRRPDWAEYWPIRWVLLNQQFESGDYLGFLSPRFGEKTGCSGRQMIERISAVDADVYSFSPYFDMSALFINSFEQGQDAHPGMLPLVRQLFARLNVDFDAEHEVLDHTQTIFCNYFVAKHEIWMEWLALAEQIFAIAERDDDTLGAELTAVTSHRGQKTHAMKVFVIERLISVILKKLSLNAHYGLDIGKVPLGVQLLHPHRTRLTVCDALKGQYRKTGQRAFLEDFLACRQHLVETVAKEVQSAQGVVAG